MRASYVMICRSKTGNDLFSHYVLLQFFKTARSFLTNSKRYLDLNNRLCRLVDFDETQPKFARAGHVYNCFYRHPVLHHYYKEKS